MIYLDRSCFRARDLLAGIVIAAVAACSDAGSTGPTAVELERLEISAPTTVLTAVGDQLQLSVRALDGTGAVVSVMPPLSWRTSNSTVAVVSMGGMVTAQTNGTVTIVAESGDVSATIELTVQQQVNRVAIQNAIDTLRGLQAVRTLTATAVDRNGHAVPGATPAWRSSHDAVLSVNGSGRVAAVAAGTAVITASVGNVSDSVIIHVARMARRAIDPFLATPAAGALWEVPVLIISYLPTADGINLDVRKTPDFYTLGHITLQNLESSLLNIFRRKKLALEEGSRFRGYKTPGAVSSIGIRVVEHLTVYEQLPASSQRMGSAWLPNFHQAFTDLGLEQIIRSRGVKQVWLAQSSFDQGTPSYDPAIHDLADARFVWESNMSSPTTGDISNSNRAPNDLPVYDHTYVLYGINFRRSQAEAVHNVGHQLEAMFSFVNFRTEGNTALFWRKFVGQDAAGSFTTGRAGWTHMPPNTIQNYDYTNPTLVMSDIEDWRPDGTGAKKAVNVNTWGNLSFPWPGLQDFPQRVETQWYIYWFQSMPGRSNGIPLGSGSMTNWWEFFGDWDAAIGSGRGLATVRDTP